MFSKNFYSEPSSLHYNVKIAHPKEFSFSKSSGSRIPLVGRDRINVNVWLNKEYFITCDVIAYRSVSITRNGYRV